MRRLTWVFTVRLGDIFSTLGINGLRISSTISIQSLISFYIHNITEKDPSNQWLFSYLATYVYKEGQKRSIPASFPHPTEAPYENWLWFAWWFLRRRCLKSVDDDVRRTTTTYDVRRTTESYLSYKLTKWAFGSGELKMRKPETNTVFEHCGFTLYIVTCPDDADGMANSVDPDQTAPLEVVRSGSTLFA